MNAAASRRLPSELLLRRAGAALAVAGIAVASYIAIADASAGAPACIAGGHGCETVAHSRYAHVLGVNVAVIGIVGYVLLLAASLGTGDGARIAGFAFAVVGLGYSLYLTYLELFVIDAICQWCVASAVVMSALFAVSATRAVGYAGSAPAGAAAS